MIFEQEPSQLLNAILPLYINGQPNILRPETRMEWIVRKVFLWQPYRVA